MKRRRGGLKGVSALNGGTVEVPSLVVLTAYFTIVPVRPQRVFKKKSRRGFPFEGRLSS